MLPKAEIPLLPFTLVIVFDPTDRRDGRGVPPPIGVDVFVILRCGMREGVASSEFRKHKNKIHIILI